MDERRFSRLRNYTQELKREKENLKEEQIRKEQKIIDMFSSKIEEICRNFAKGIKWKYKKRGDGIWKCAIVKPAFLYGGCIEVSLSASGEISIIARPDLPYQGSLSSDASRPGKGVLLDITHSTFDEVALIKALEEEYKYIVEHLFYLKSLRGW